MSAAPQSRSVERHTLLALAPLALILGGLFGGGLLLAFFESINAGSSFDISQLSLRHYLALGSDREFLASLGFSLWVASAATMLSLALGLVIASAFHRMAQWSRPGWRQTLLQFPLAIPHLSLALVVLHLMAPSGILSRIAHAAGFLGEPGSFPSLVQDRFGMGIIMAYVWKEAPFLAVVALAMLSRVGRELGDAARTLGASPWVVWRRIHLPLVAPGVVAAALAAFAFVFGAYEVPLLLGRTYPAMLGVVAERRFRSVDVLDQPAAIAIALTISAVAALLVWAYLRLARYFVGERPVLF
jgi:putative spermidine/putrescine transport system permease protein